MKTLTLKLHDEIFEETDQIARKLKITRNKYINEAIHAFNLLNNRKLLKHQLHKESGQVNKCSMVVLTELEKL